jgi:hypothetical protein
MAAMATRLLLDERILADGRHSCTYATLQGDRVEISDDEGVAGPLSIAALDRVMTKYGLPLDEDIDVAGEALELGDGRRLRRMRYHSRVDAEGRDYLVWEVPGEDARAVIATHATAALRYLVARLAEERTPQKTEG